MHNEQLWGLKCLLLNHWCPSYDRPQGAQHANEWICVERVKPLRFAERGSDYDAFFTRFNDAVTAASH